MSKSWSQVKLLIAGLLLLGFVGCSSKDSGGSPAAAPNSPPPSDPTNTPAPVRADQNKISVEAVFELAQRGDSGEISMALRPSKVTKEYRKKLLSSRNNNGDTPLLAALRARNLEAAEEFLRFEASPFHKDRNGKNPNELAAEVGLDAIKGKLETEEAIWANELFLAIDGSNFERVKEIIESLEAPADLHPTTSAYIEYQRTEDRNSPGEKKVVKSTHNSPIRHLSDKKEPLTEGQLKIADFLLAKGANSEISWQANAMSTPVMPPMGLAALNSQAALVLILGKHGAKADGISEPYAYFADGRRTEGFHIPPLYYAIYSFSPNANPLAEATVEALLKIGANPNLKRGGAPLPLDFAAERGSCKMVKALISAGGTTNGISDLARLRKIEECRN